MDVLVLLLHLPGDGVHVTLVGIVVGVQQGRRHDPRRGGRHEQLAVPSRVLARGFENELALPLRLAQARVLDLRYGLWRVEDLRSRHAAVLPERRVVRKVDEVAEEGPRTLAAEALHAEPDVGLEADTRLLAVVDRVDAARDLLADHVPDRRLAFTVERRPVDRLAALLADQQIAQRPTPRQASNVSRQDPVPAVLHGASSDSTLCSPRPSRKHD